MIRSNTVESAAGEIIQVPNTLRQKVGPRFGVDAFALLKAEAALKSLSPQFAQWLQDEVVKLETARAALHGQGATPATMDSLYLHSHDLKGLGTTYDFPLISRVASSLCKLMDAAAPRTAAPLGLVDAHIDAIRAIVRDDIRDPEHATGLLLARTLEAGVRDHMAMAKGSATSP